MSSATPYPDIDGSLSDDSAILIERAVDGDQEAFEELFSRHRDRLKRMIVLRLDRRVRGKVDASDVLREACAEAARRLSEYAKNPGISIFLWLRGITALKLDEFERRLLGNSATSGDDLVALHCGALPLANSVSLAAHLLGTMSSPSEGEVKVETRIHVQEALNDMDSKDREILALKHFERLSNDEIADVLGMSKGEVGKRYLSAVKRLRVVLSRIPGFRGL